MSEEPTKLPAARRAILTAAAAVLLAFALAQLAGAGVVDDTWTGLRHTKHLVEGHGPVFNPGERVEGYTSILWTYLPALPGLLGIPLGAVIVAMSYLATGGLVLALLWLLPVPGTRGARLEQAALALGIVCLPGCFFWSASGMDSVAFAALVVALAASALEDLRAEGSPALSRGTGILMALASLQRMEALLLAAFIGIVATARHRRFDRHWWRHIAQPFVWLGGMWALITAARFAYFGEILPNTFYAKVVSDRGHRLYWGALYLGKWALQHAPLLLAAGVVIAVALRRALIARFEVRFLAGFWALYCAYVVWVGGDHFLMSRFLLPATALVFLLLLRAWSALVPSLTQQSRPILRRLLVATIFLSSMAQLGFEGQIARTVVGWTQQWRRIGQWLHENTPPDTLIATVPIGAISYFSERPIVDMLGIADRTIAHEGDFYPDAAPTHGRHLTDYVYGRDPDLVVYGGSALKLGRGIKEIRFSDSQSIGRLLANPLYEFVNDPRCAERYEHVIVEFDDAGYVEMQKRRGFDLPVPYRSAPGIR